MPGKRFGVRSFATCGLPCMLQSAKMLLTSNSVCTVDRIGMHLPARAVEQPAVRAGGTLADTHAAVPQRPAPIVRLSAQTPHGQPALLQSVYEGLQNYCSLLLRARGPATLQPSLSNSGAAKLRCLVTFCVMQEWHSMTVYVLLCS